MVLHQLGTNWGWIIEGRQKGCMSRRGRVALAQPGAGQGWLNWGRGVRWRSESHVSLNGPLCHLDLGLHLGNMGLDTSSSHPIKWDLGSPWGSAECRVFGLAGGGRFMGKPQHLPHSLGGMPQVRLPMLVFVRARPSYRAAHWKRLFSLPHQCVEGSRTPVVALVCGWGCAISCELEPLRRLEIVC